MPKEVETDIYGIDNMELSKKKCIPCEGGIPPLNEEECNVLSKEIDDNWEECYGDAKFDVSDGKFPDPSSMISTIKNELGYRVTLWIHPFINLGNQT